MQKNIVVIGSSNVDLIMKMARLPELGETVTDGEFVQVYGGKGANQAVGAARAGGRVRFVNCVGDDAYTERMVQNFRDDGIDTELVFRETGIPSGHALVMIGNDGHNYLSVAPGSNYRLTPARVDQSADRIKEAAMVVLQNEIPMASNARVLEIAHAAGVPVLWNFAPAMDYPTALFDYKPMVVANEVEARFLTGMEVTDRESATTAAGALLDKGASLAIVTLGSAGAVTRNSEETVFTPAFKVQAVDTTAAGDVFCGSLAVALTEGRALADAVRFASAAAALSVQVLGAQPSAPSRSDIDRLLA